MEGSILGKGQHHCIRLQGGEGTHRIAGERCGVGPVDPRPAHPFPAFHPLQLTSDPEVRQGAKV